jgi:RNA polymerase sigma-70 factor, ECF subfamily
MARWWGSFHVDVPDSLLVTRAQAGDAAAFDALVDRHYGDCLRYAVRMLGERADAEEAVQDTFVRAFRSIRRYDNRGQLRGWLLRILVNRCRSVIARRARRARLLLERPNVPEADATTESPDSLREEVERGLARLPPEQREAFLLKHVEELSYEEMSALTGVGVSALKMRVKRASERLREILKEVVYDG